MTSITSSCLEANDFQPREHAPGEHCFIKAREAEFSCQFFKLLSFHIVSSHGRKCRVLMITVWQPLSYPWIGGKGPPGGGKKAAEVKVQICSHSLIFFLLL